jgi:hypothetical protein
MDHLADRNTQAWLAVAVLLSGLALFFNNLNATGVPGEPMRVLGALFLMFGVTTLRAVQENSPSKGRG